MILKKILLDKTRRIIFLAFRGKIVLAFTKDWTPVLVVFLGLDKNGFRTIGYLVFQRVVVNTKMQSF